MIYSLKIEFKKSNLKDEFERIDPRLRAIMLEVSKWLVVNSQPHMVITSLIRRDNRKSVHYYGRGADIRSRNMDFGVIERLCDHINRNWPYGKPGRKTALWHDVGKGQHIHLQVRAI